MKGSTYLYDVSGESEETKSEINVFGTERVDGRKDDDIREIEIETGLIHGVDGSCKFTQGDTSVLVSIFGPTAMDVRDVDYQKAILKVKIEKDFGCGDFPTTVLEEDIRSVFENILMLNQFPRTKVTISIIVLKSNGSLLSCCLNGVMVALLDLGLPCSTMISSLTMACVAEKHYFDPRTTETENSKYHIVLCTDNSSHGVRYLKIKGKVDLKNFDPIVTKTKKACNSILVSIKNHFRTFYEG